MRAPVKRRPLVPASRPLPCRAAAAGLALALRALAAQGGGAAPAGITYQEGAEIARLANPEIRESSGLAASRCSPDVFWTHNDSGDKPRLFAFNLKGEDLGAYAVQAQATDWEDMASFTLNRKHYLLVGDIGDNATNRPSRALLVVEEPRAAGKPGHTQSLHLAARLEYTYEDGPRNCEAVAVDSQRREVLLVSKTAEAQCTAYVLPLLLGSSSRKTAVARAIGTLNIPMTTAMDLSDDGLRAIVLTYGDAYEYTRSATEDWKAAFARPPRTVRMPPRAQGESICYGSDGRTLYLTSEKAPSPLLRVSPSSP